MIYLLLSLTKIDQLNCDLLRYQKVWNQGFVGNYTYWSFPQILATTLNQIEAYRSNQLHFFDLFLHFRSQFAF